MSPVESEHRDPRTRILLELALEVFEDANDTESYVGSNTGVFVGGGVGGMAVKQLSGWFVNSTTATSTALCMQANLISFKFDLRGPSCVVATGCSSSGYAMWQAVEAMRNGRCEMAIVAGTALLFDPRLTMGYQKLGVLSNDGRCKSFDEEANGYVRSEGVGMVLLKPFRKAVEDGNRIYCVLTGVGCTSDGQSGGTKSLTTPSGEAQARGLRMALDDGGVSDPREVFFLECHATGTAVGDPVEVNSAGEVLSFDSDGKKVRSDDGFEPLRLGSIKASVGHLEHASFIASLLKCIMMLYKGQLVPNIQCESPNPKIRFDDLQMRVQLTPESFDPHNRLLLINSFGFGGANVCTLLRGYRPKKQMPPVKPVPPPYCFLAYARTADALKLRVEAFREFGARLLNEVKGESDESEGEESEDPEPKDVVLSRLMHALNARKIQQHRFVSIGMTPWDKPAEEVSFSTLPFSPPMRLMESRPVICFVFSGQGPQHSEMGRKLYERFPIFRQTIDACHAAYEKCAGSSPILRIIGKEEPRYDESEMQDPDLVLPSFCALQMALFDLWRAAGVVPDLVMFHSLGEMSCLYASGAVGLELSMQLVHARLQIVRAVTEQGKMMAVGASRHEVLTLAEDHDLDKTVFIAADNSPVSCTVGGEPESIHALAAVLKDLSIFHRVLNIAKAFHTKLIMSAKPTADRVLPPFRPQIVPVSIPMVNTVKKACVVDGLLDPMHVWENALHEVQFREAVALSLRLGSESSGGRTEDILFVEVGPHPVLSRSLKECGAEHMLTSMNRRREELTAFFDCCCHLARYRVEIDWSLLCGAQDRLDTIPRYSFDRKRLLFDHPSLSGMRLAADREKMPPMVGRRVVDLSQEDLLWETFVSANTHPYLTEHVIQGAAIMPAAGFIEMILEISEKQTLERLEILSSMSIPDAPMKVMTRKHGSLVEIFSSTDSEDWHLHCRGSVTDGCHLTSIPSLPEIQGRTFDKTRVYARLRESALEYGETFRNLVSVTVGDGECVAVVAVPEDLDTQNYAIHPVILDTFFQAFECATGNIAKTYLPANCGRLVLLSSDFSGELVCHCVLTHQSEERIVGDIAVFSQAPELALLVRITDFEATRLRTDLPWDDFRDCALVWQPKALPELALVPTDLESRWATLQEQSARIEGVLAFYLKPALADMARLVESRERSRHAEWASNLVKNAPELVDPGFLDELEGFEIEAALIRRVGENVVDLQVNRSNDVSSIMFQDDLLTRMYSESISCRTVLDDFAPILVSIVRPLVEQKRVVRILEIGSGTGALARVLFPLLAEFSGSVEFYYTDVSPRFVVPRDEFLKYDFVRYEVLDAALPFSEQGFADGSFDIVVGFDAIHATPVVDSALREIRRALVPGGLLFLLECTQPPQYANFIFGVFDDWWGFSDHRTHVWQSRDGWKQVLIKAGYDSVWYSGGEKEIHSVVMGRNPFVTEDSVEPALTKVSVFRSPNAWELMQLAQKKMAESESEPVDDLCVIVVARHILTHPEYSGVYGVVKVLQNEAPFRTMIVDVEDATEDEADRILKDVIACPSKYERQAIVKEGTPHVPRLVRMDENFTTMDQPLQDRSFRASLLGQRQVGFVDFAVPPLRPTEVLVDVRSTSLNFRDVLGVVGLIANVGFNSLGDVSGVVLSVGEDVKTINVGDSVFGGTLVPLANRIVTKEALLSQKPENLSFSEAGTIPTVFVTAYIALIDLANIGPGDRVLIHSASGGVGQAAIQLAQWKGAEVYATVGSEAKREFLRKTYGVEVFGDSHSSVWDQEILASVPEGVDVVLNSLGGENIQRGLRLLRSYGRFVEIGKSDIMKDTPVGLSPFLKNLTMLSLQLDLYFKDSRGLARYTRALSSLRDLFASGVLRPMLDRTFKLTDVQNACDYMLQNKHLGKIAIEIDVPEDLIPSDVSYSSKATYVLSGGLGSVGFELCRHLVENGARFVVLLSRSGRVSRYQKQRITELEEVGAKVFVSKTDVTSREAVDVMYDSLVGMEFPPVRGIIHLAMVLRDAPFDRMTEEEFHIARTVKIVGAENLVGRYGAGDLDFFVGFSSISCLLGNPHQSNYAAGNSQLEALCRRLMAKGIPAHSIALAAVGDVGILSQDVNIRLHLIREVFGKVVNVDEVIRSFVRACKSPRSLVVPPFDYTTCVKNLFKKTMGPVLSHLSDPVAGKGDSDGPSSQVTLESVAEVVRGLLQIEGEIDPDEPLIAYGMDSLTAVDFSWRIKKEFQLEISQMQLLGGMTVRKIVARGKATGFGQE